MAEVRPTKTDAQAQRVSPIKAWVRSTPFLRSAKRFGLRLGIGLAYWGAVGQRVRAWLFQSREVSNFTYDLTQLNKRYLSAQVADITGRSYDQIMGYIAELENNEPLRAHIEACARQADNSGRADMPYGRRLGWYAIARATKPKVVVETGVDQGLGSCVLTAALAQNASEGHPGRYYGVDINPRAGYLLTGLYRDFGEICYGDAIETLQKLSLTIDLFINDSDHSAAYEGREYQTIAAMLGSRALVLGDNAHATGELLDFALRTGWQFVFFKEQPANHWYPGAGIGVAFRRQEWVEG